MLLHLRDDPDRYVKPNVDPVITAAMNHLRGPGLAQAQEPIEARLRVLLEKLEAASPDSEQT